MATLKKYLSLFVLSLALLVPGISDASIIDTNSVWVTDVTPVQFAVVWGTSEPAIGSVNVFADADGTIPVMDAVVKFESPEHPHSEDIGVLKVRVNKLQPNTHYYFQIKSTSKNSSSVYTYPDGPPYLEVTTEQGSVIVRNDVLAQQVSIEGGKSTQGTLVIAEIDLASYPVTGWAGHGVPEGWVAIDTNNFYDKVAHVNLELLGGESITLTYFCGFMGSVVTSDTVPAESGGIQPVSVVANLSDSGSEDDDGDDPSPSPSPSPSPTASSESGGSGGGGGACFISILSSQPFDGLRASSQ